MPATARFRNDRGAWFVFYRVGAKRWNKRIGPTAEDGEAARETAEAFNAALDEQRERSASLYPGGPAPFDVIARAWWDAKSPAMPRSSVVSKRCVVYERLIPHFQDIDCRRIDEDRVRACAVAMAVQRKHARETVETTGSVLDSILRWAWRRETLEVMPVPRDRSDKNIRAIFRETAAALCAPPSPIEAWSREEALALVETAAARGPWLGDPVLFASQTGCRRGEIIALEWRDVDLQRGRATIRQSSTRGQTKTTKADQQRTVTLSRAALEMLERRAARGRAGIVFRDRKGKPWTDYGLAGYWERIRGKASREHGVRPLKFHCWRHTWATWALASGEDPVWCASQIGDTMEVFLQRYAHAMPGTKRSLDFLELSPHGGAPRAPADSPGSSARAESAAGAAPQPRRGMRGSTRRESAPAGLPS